MTVTVTPESLGERIRLSVRSLASEIIRAKLFRVEALCWKNKKLCLGGYSFVNCKFENCRLLNDGPFIMEHCVFDGSNR